MLGERPANEVLANPASNGNLHNSLSHSSIKESMNSFQAPISSLLI
jgi:hypothetical protein